MIHNISKQSKRPVRRSRLNSKSILAQVKTNCNSFFDSLRIFCGIEKEYRQIFYSIKQEREDAVPRNWYSRTTKELMKSQNTLSYSVVQ